MSFITVDNSRHRDTHVLAERFDPLDSMKSNARQINTMMAQCAQRMINMLQDGPDLNQGLTAMLTARDHFEHQSMADHGGVAT